MRFYALAERPWIEEEDGAGYWGLPDGAIGSVDLAPLGSQSWVFVTSDQPIAGEATFGDGTRLHQHSLTPSERIAWTGLTGVALPSDVTLLDALWHTLTAAADPDGGERAKPIMPTHRGRLELHLGGHSLVRAEQMPADPTQHPAWPKIQAVLQNDYREIHDGPRGKGLARQRQSGNPTLARKYLGAMADKYRIPADVAPSLLVPRDMQRVTALRPTTELWDDFDRPEQNLNGSQSPQGWLWSSNGGSVRGDRTVGVERGGWAEAGSDLSSPDHRSGAEIISHNNAGPGVRLDWASETGYISCWYANWANWWLHRVVDGDPFRIERWDGVREPGDFLETIADGSTISIEVNDELIGSVTDTQISSGLRAGFGNYTSSGGTAVYANWSASDLLSPPVEITGDLDAIEAAPDTAAVRGSVAVTGSLSAREPAADTASATGSVSITGEIVARERGGDGAQMLGSPIAAARMSATEAGQDSTAITGSAIIAASLDAREAGSDTANAAVTVAITGALDATEPASDTAEIVEGENGEITGTLDAREPGPDSATVVGSVAITGAMVAREPGGDGAQMRGGVAVTGKLAAAETGADALAATGSATITGALDARDHGPDSAEIAGGITISASLHAIELGGDTAEFLEIPPPLPDVQVTVPGVWMRREAAGTWQRRTAVGIWRRIS